MNMPNKLQKLTEMIEIESELHEYCEDLENYSSEDIYYTQGYRHALKTVLLMIKELE